MAIVLRVDFTFPKKESAAIKQEVLKHIANNRRPSPLGGATWEVEGVKVHVRFCSRDKSGSAKYKFNTNPTSLSADFELWICGASTSYYLIPRSVIEGMYDDPEAYVDQRHRQLRVISLDCSPHSATYARKGKSIGLEQYYQKMLPV